MSKYTFHVNMTCEGCSNAVKRVLGKLGDKVHNVEIKLDEKLVTVDTDMEKEEVLEVLRKTGKEVKFVE